MALWKGDNDEDEFFGSLEESDTGQTCVDGNERHSGLWKAEHRAVAARFKNIGYHESYEEGRESKLQEGFEEGFKASFENAKQIGILLGEASMRARRESASKELKARCLEISRDVRDNIQDMDLRELLERISKR